MRGQIIFRYSFLAITQIGQTTLKKHATDIQSSLNFEKYKMKRSQVRKDKIGSNADTMRTFLQKIPKRHGAISHSGRVSQDHSDVFTTV